MVSNIKKASVYYKEQEAGKVGKTMSEDKKLLKDSKGFYLNKSKSNGENFKERVSANDLIYSRQEGTTKYSKEKDYGKKTQRLEENRKDPQAHLHKGDMARGDKGVYRV